MVSAIVLLTAVVVALSAGPDPVIGAITSSLQSILKNTHGSKEYEYPTDITRDIYPVCTLWVFLCQPVGTDALRELWLTSDLDSRALSQVRISARLLCIGFLWPMLIPGQRLLER